MIRTHCADCGCRLWPGDVARCEDCKRKRARAARGKRARLGRVYREYINAYHRARHASDPERRNATQRARRLEHKLSGRCTDCDAAALSDNNRCERHRESHLAWEREHPRKETDRERE